MPEEPRHFSWGSAGDPGHSQEVIDSYNWMIVDTAKYECKER